MSATKRNWPLGPIIVGLGGFCVLVTLGFWQVQRLQWKNAIIAEAEQRLTVAPEALPATLDPGRDDYKRVTVSGRFDHASENYVLTSMPPNGPGFAIITVFETIEGRRILVDRGFVPQMFRDPSTRTDTREDGMIKLEGVLRWPSDKSSFTPDPNPSIREWYSREVPPLAEAMDTEEVMIVQGPTDGPGWPRGGAAQVNIRNQHLPYAIQWFAIAGVWALMSILWFRKVARSDADA
jgi:surfeit locus 1 family protein